MANPFSNFKEYVDKPKRNSYDLSFQNNLTLDYGYIYPVCCIETVPGVSYQIKPNMAFNFMPTAFPIQTRQRAYVQFFYVRTRNLWKDWMDFIGKTKTGLIPPYIDFAGQTPTTGSLYDYFGLPTTLSGSYGNGIRVNNGILSSGEYAYDETTLVSFISDTTFSNLSSIESYYNGLKNFDSEVLLTASKSKSMVVGSSTLEEYVNDMYSSPDTAYWIWNVFMTAVITVNEANEYLDSLSDSDLIYFRVYAGSDFLAAYNKKGGYISMSKSDGTLTGRVKTFSSLSYSADGYYEFSMSKSSFLSIIGDADYFRFGLLCNKQVSAEVPLTFYNSETDSSFGPKGKVVFVDFDVVNNSRAFVSNSNTFFVKDIDVDSSPYYDSSSPNKDSQLKLDAYPFRAYEAICNVYFRDDRNNPFMLNGQPEYNKYITTNEGGADNTRYKLYRRNWEQDFLTTAVQSPQQGIAPLVGITSYGDMTFAAEDGTLYHAKANVSSDGNTIESFSVLSSDMPSGNLRALVDMASSGIGINDLRNVNALQRWLETNIRRGFKYRDQIMSHFGVEVRYDELDMPEFIGGMSQDVSIRQVNNMSVADGSTLGDYAGQMFIGGSSGKSITHYCDEHGYIIGVLSIVPVPVYSQLLPKHFLKNDPLDYYFPEFGHIGMQPIMYNEVCPVQTFNDNPADLNKEFGYQRAWYDYIQKVDECHGLFRTELQNFLLNRVFNEKPELSEEFLKVDPEQLNKVFTVTKYGNKILGNIYFEIEAKEPIPLFGIPSLT